MKTINWVPNTFEPIYICEYGKIDEKKISNECIGRLPNTDMGIPLLDINSLVTHNTAIQGLFYYLDENEIQNQIKDEYLEVLNSRAERTGGSDKPSEWGNKDIYIKFINTIIKEFINSDKKNIGNKSRFTYSKETINTI